MAISSVFITIQSAATSLEVNSLESQEKMLLGRKKELEEDLVKNLSVSDLQTKSSDMGFTKPTDLVYISQSEPVANLPSGN